MIAPAIKLAEDGFVLEQGDVDLLDYATDDSRRTCGFRRDLPAQRRADAGRAEAGAERPGENPAHHLRQGRDGFYKGWVADAMVIPARPTRASSPRPTSTNTRPELAPIECDYRGYHVVSAPPPSSGGVVICEIMNILEGYPMKDLGFHSAQGMHYQIEAMRHAYVDRNSYLGDPDFVKNPIEHLLDKNYATKLRDDRAEQGRRSPQNQAGRRAPRRQQHHPLFHRRQVGQRGVGDLHPQRLVRCRGDGEQDRGNPQRRNGRLHLKVGVPNMYGLVQGEANAIAPGKAPLSSMSPTIVTKDGKVVMVVGTPGGSRIITATLLTMLNVIDYGMNLQEAVDAPRFHQQWMPEETNLEDFAASPDTKKLLESWGHKFAGPQDANHIAAILVGAPSLGGKPVGKNRFYGANDPRRNTGLSLGY
jgi:gamma-glutamyltranspeptidase/glutathione hydrolase